LKKNALLMIPKHNENVCWEDSANILLRIQRDGSIHKILNKVFKSPLSPTVELDEIGSYVWKMCDGVSNLHEISEKMKTNFGDTIEPVYDRLLQYIGILKNNNFIKLE